MIQRLGRIRDSTAALLRSPGGRVLTGHTGGMPGHVTAVFTDRSCGAAVIVLMNSSTPPDPMAFAAALLDTVLDRDPAEPEPWRRGTSPCGCCAARTDGSSRCAGRRTG